MSRETSRHRSSPIALWFMLGIVIAAILVSALLGLLAWRQKTQVQTLQAEVQALRKEYEAAQKQLLATQDTVTALENRLVSLEANDPAQQVAALQALAETNKDSQEIAELQTSLAGIQAKVDGFQTALDTLSARLDALALTGNKTEAGLPPEVRLAVTRQRQSHNLSCESSSASMVAQYLGINLNEAQVLAMLPLNANPHRGFRGNVDGPTGGIEDYGVYASPILDILNKQGLQARLVAGGLDGIKAAIAQGNPVIAWVTYDCLPSTPVERNIEGQTVTLVPYQHVVVVTGYNAQGVWANDPWDGQEDFYATTDFERAMSYFDDMAVVVAAPQE